MTMHNAPDQLADAWTRLYRAKENYDVLTVEAMNFLYEYVKGMVKGWNPETEGFVLQMRHPKEDTITGRPRALVVDIVEDLRAALDYMVFELSALNDPNLNESVPQFVIADTREEFERQSKRRLRYLTEEQRSEFIEKLQPFSGNSMLGILRDISGQSKHRRLLSLRDSSSLEIHLAETKRKDEYVDWFMFPMEKDRAIFARPQSCSISLLDKYDALGILKTMAEHVGDIVRSSHCFFEGRPFTIKIVPAEGWKEG